MIILNFLNIHIYVSLKNLLLTDKNQLKNNVTMWVFIIVQKLSSRKNSIFFN